MIGHRDGHIVSVCDGCYRPRRAGEPGWQHANKGGLAESRATDATDPHGNVRVGVSPEGPLDWCPDCVAERTNAVLLRSAVHVVTERLG